MLIISLKHFLLTGHFGPVHCGMHKDRAIELLGEPHGENDFGAGSGGLSYAWYEMFYDIETGLISAMQNDHLQYRGKWHRDDILFKTDRVRMDGWFLKHNRSTTYREVIRILQRERIHIEDYPHCQPEEVSQLKLQSGVTIDFEGGKKIADRLLYGIRYFPQ